MTHKTLETLKAMRDALEDLAKNINFRHGDDITEYYKSEAAINEAGFIALDSKQALDEAIRRPEGQLEIIGPEDVQNVSYSDGSPSREWEVLARSLSQIPQGIPEEIWAHQMIDDDGEHYLRADYEKCGLNETLGHQYVRVDIHEALKKERDELRGAVQISLTAFQMYLDVLGGEVTAQQIASTTNNAMQICEEILTKYGG